MSRTPLLVAGLIAIGSLLTADAFAEGCPEWLTLGCPENASSNAVAHEDAKQSQRPQLSRPASVSATGRGTKQARPGGAGGATDPKAQPAQEPESTGAKAGGATRSGQASGDQLHLRQGERRGARIEPAMTDEEKQALFQKFLTWQNKQRRDAETSR
jgi:hypothetical protein